VIGQLRAMVERRQKRPSRAQVLASRPLRTPLVTWSRELRDENEDPDGRAARVLLKVPRRADRFGDMIARLFRLPNHKRIELDEIGSEVWELCDGAHSVDAITRAICAHYRLNRRQGEASVTAYLKMLAERRLIGLKGESARSGERRASAGRRKQA
jgi:hypothetical protein